MKEHPEKKADRQPVEIGSIWEAKERIASHILQTPLLLSPALSEHTGGPVYLKLENLQPTGAFKIRGAANKILSLSPERQKRGVTTFSTGNHGLAVSYMARRFGIPAVVCVSRRVPPEKTDPIRRMGAKLVVHGNGQDDAESQCHRLEWEEGLTLIRPFDDPEVIAGQGTIGLELLEQVPDLGTVIVPLSGGGLFSGIGLAVKSNRPDARMIGVSMEHSAVMHQSLLQGKPVTLQEQDTLADSLLGGIGLENRYTFSMVRRWADETRLVSEKEIAEGMSWMFHQHKMVVEGAAATGLGALLSGRVRSGSQPVVVTISGCNVDPSVLLKAIDAGA
ncbi:hydroxyectoine utilization dehydratase EutB [Paludifilum halophilum]|uniref:hydroxyectoine utilization dehydratase EutB n=1 Tax=Paludifilum halophilum TaxID=1642702 RepID=UPI001F0ACE5D|nr:hydroxyectoine utilization dehydratase EutB [Paludifilum halophilum]